MFGQYPGYAFAPYPFPQQQRLNVLEQQYPQFAQYPQGGGNNPQMPTLKGRAVTSFDEAKAAMIDLECICRTISQNLKQSVYRFGLRLRQRLLRR